jgi:hypothetical protein
MIAWINRPMSPRAIITSIVVILYVLVCVMLKPAYPSTRMARDGIYIGHYVPIGWPVVFLGVRLEDGRLDAPGQPFEQTDLRVAKVHVSFLALALDAVWIYLLAAR